MKTKLFIGIDISKLSLDVSVIDPKEKLKHYSIKNTPKAFQSLLNKVHKGEQMFIGMENTGRYNWPVYEALETINANVYVISPLHLHKSLGLVRGKNDKVDSSRIAQFVKTQYTNLKEWKVPIRQITQLGVLLSERNNRIKKIKEIKSRSCEYNLFKKYGLEKMLTDDACELIELYNKQIKCYEKQIEEIINQDKGLHKKVELMKSIPGVGKILCWTLLSKSNIFNLFEDPRKLACYAGVVPFDYQSGTSIKSRQRISVFADKKLKTVLHMAALRAIRLDGELKEYYKRKVDEGKNKMLVINAVRNKLVHRICAVINKMEPYDKNYNKNLVLS